MITPINESVKKKPTKQQLEAEITRLRAEQDEASTASIEAKEELNKAINRDMIKVLGIIDLQPEEIDIERLGSFLPALSKTMAFLVRRFYPAEQHEVIAEILVKNFCRYLEKGED